MNTSMTKRATMAIYIGCTFLSTSYITIVSMAYILNSYSNVPASTVTLLLTLPSLIGLAVSFLIGPIAMKANKKVLLIISYCCMIVSVGFYAVVGAKSIGLLLVAAVFCGLSQGSSGTLQNSIIAEYIPPENRANVMAVVNALAYGGTIFYNIVGGKLAAANGGANWNHAYFLGFILIPTTILFAVLLPKKADGEPDTAASADDSAAEAPVGALGQPQAKLPAYPVILCFLYGISMAFQYCTGLNMSNYYVNLLRLGDASMAGLVMSGGTLGVFVSGLLYKYYSKPLKNWVPVVGMLGYAVGSLLIAYIPNTGVFLASQFLMGASTGCMTPYFVATISIRTPPKWVPVAMSLFMGLMNGFMFIAQYILDFLGKIGVDAGDPVAYVGNKFAVSGYGLLACTVLCVVLFPLYDKKHSETSGTVLPH